MLLARAFDAMPSPFDSPLLDELPEGALVTSTTGHVVAVNSKLLAMVGRERVDVIGRPIESLVAEEDMLHLVGFEAMFRDDAHDTNIIFSAPDGGLRRLLVCSTTSSDGQHIVLTARASGLVQEELANTTRWAASERERAQDLAVARDALAATNSALRTAQLEVETAYLKLQGEMHARERLEKELRLAQKLEGLGQLAAGVAHEINTPMQYVGDNLAFLERAFGRLGEYLELAQRALAGDKSKTEVQAELEAAKQKWKLHFLLDNAPKALKDSKAGVEHVSTIVRAMKSFAHVDHDEKALGDINQALSDTLVVAQSEYKSVAVVETDFGTLPKVLCYLGRLNQVFLNLVVNAAHAIADSGRSCPGHIRITSRAEAGVVLVSIADDGSGIPEAVRDKIFDPFFTTKPVGKGTGQGLSIARSIVLEAHAGTLTFETELGRGTTFTVRLPVDGASALTSLDSGPSLEQ